MKSFKEHINELFGFGKSSISDYHKHLDKTQAAWRAGDQKAVKKGNAKADKMARKIWPKDHN